MSTTRIDKFTSNIEFNINLSTAIDIKTPILLKM
jgi:hypothetical protein